MRVATGTLSRALLLGEGDADVLISTDINLILHDAQMLNDDLRENGNVCLKKNVLKSLLQHSLNKNEWIHIILFSENSIIQHEKREIFRYCGPIDCTINRVVS